MNISKHIQAAAIMAAAWGMLLSSCGVVYDDLPPCTTGVELRFVYDYNLERANAFHSQVDCLTLHVYDADGRFVSTTNITGSELADENWRLPVELAPGQYHFVAYGGIACSDASFAHVPEPATGTSYRDISMQLKALHAGSRLHDHYHGELDLTIEDGADGYGQATLAMSKTTNHFRILLQHVNGKPVDGSAFSYAIVADNGVLDHANNPVASRELTYPSWDSGTISVADDSESRADEPTTVAYAEISTSRLMMGSDARIVITDNSTGGEIITLPLPRYLAMGKSSADDMGNQEYLDRCSRWNMTFFLDSNDSWADTRIIINGWSVRLNSSDF